MPHVATCPKCEFEFTPNEVVARGQAAECPACGALFALDEDLPFENAERDSSDFDLQEAVEEKLDASQLHIDNWLLSKSKSSDDSGEGDKETEESAESKASAATVSDLSATIEIPTPGLGHEEIDLETTEDVEDGPTWDDAEHMDRLLAEIDSDPVDDYLPVARGSHSQMNDDERHVLADEIGETVEFSPSEFGRLDMERVAPPSEDAVSEPTDEPNSTEFDVVPSSRPRRQRSLVRALIGAVVAAPLGLIGGYLALLWISGPAGDFLDLAQYFPEAVLPASMHGATAVAANDSANSSSLLNQLDSREPAPIDDTPAEALPDPGEIASDSPAMPETRPQPGQQVNFDAPVPTATGGLTDAADGRYATPVGEQPAMNPTANLSNGEPAPGDSSLFAPAPAAERSSVPTIAGAPTYSRDQLAAALSAAREAQPGLIAGDLSDQAVLRTKGLSYSTLAELAEVQTFVEDDGAAMAGSLSPTAAESLFVETLSDPRIRREVAQITPVWIDSAHRRHGGIFFAGTIASLLNKGPLVVCTVDTGIGDPLIVVAPSVVAQRLPSGGPIAVVGSLIDNPGERIEGYAGAERVVWAKSLLPLDR